jgi:hypothetical protein
MRRRRRGRRRRRRRRRWGAEEEEEEEEEEQEEEEEEEENPMKEDVMGGACGRHGRKATYSYIERFGGDTEGKRQLGRPRR